MAKMLEKKVGKKIQAKLIEKKNSRKTLESERQKSGTKRS